MKDISNIKDLADLEARKKAIEIWDKISNTLLSKSDATEAEGIINKIEEDK